MRDVFVDLRNGGAGLSSAPGRTSAVLTAVSAFIDQQEGIAASYDTHRSAIPYMAAFLSALSNPQSDVSAIEANVFLLARLLQSGTLSSAVVQRKIEDIAECLYGLIQRKSEDHEQITRDCLRCIALLADYGSGELMGKKPSNTGSMKMFQALLVFSLDPRDAVRTAARDGVALVVGKCLTDNSGKTDILTPVIDSFLQRELGLTGDTVGPDVLTSVVYMSEMIETLVDIDALSLAKASKLFSVFIQFWSILSNRQDVSNFMMSAAQVANKQCLIYEAILKLAEAIFVRYAQEDDILMLFEVLNSLEVPINATWSSKVARVNTMTSACAATKDGHTTYDTIKLVMETLMDLTVAPDEVPQEHITQCFLSMQSLITLPIVSIADAKQWISTLFGYRLRTTWAQGFNIARVFFSCRSSGDYFACKDLIDHLLQVYNSSLSQGSDKLTFSSEVISSARSALGTAVSVFTSVQILRNSTFNSEISLLWMLEIIKDNLQKEPISHFGQVFSIVLNSPVLVSKSRCLIALWGIFPSFCRCIDEVYTNDTQQSHISHIQQLLPLISQACSDLSSAPYMSFIGRGLLSICCCSLDLTGLKKEFGQLLPVIVQWILNTAGEGDLHWILQSVGYLARLCDAEVVAITFKQTLRLLLELDSDDSMEGKQYLEVCNVLVPILKDVEVLWLYKTIRLHIQQSKPQMQKKAYKVLCTVLEKHLTVLANNGINVLEDMGISTTESGSAMSDSSEKLSSVDPAAKKCRLRCLHSLIKFEDELPGEFERKLLIGTCGEVMHAVKEHGMRTRQMGFDLLACICSKMRDKYQQPGVQQLIGILIAGLAGSSHTQSGALICLRTATRMCKQYLEESNWDQLLEIALLLSKCDSKEVSQSALLLIQTFSSTAPLEFIESHLQQIVDVLLHWTKDSKKNKFKQHTRVITERLLRRYGEEKLRAVYGSSSVSSNSAVFDAVARELRRKERAKQQRQSARDSRETSEMAAKKNGSMMLKETEDGPMDLLDAGSQWDKMVGNDDEDVSESGSEEDFKVGTDGRLIIEGVESEDSNESGQEDEGVEVNSDDEDYTMTGKKLTSVLSVVSRKTAATTKTTPYSLKSNGTGWTDRKRKTRKASGADESSNLVSGDRYRSRKSGGDVRRPGEPEPFAFLGFHKKLLNKRLKHKSIGQFQSIVRAADKGAQAGIKMSKKHKRARKQ